MNRCLTVLKELSVVLVLAWLSACRDIPPGEVPVAGERARDPAAAASDSSRTAAPKESIRAVIGTFGERLRNVSLLAPADSVRGSLEQEYAGIVTPELLETWISSPQEAPGRVTSSPWPERIEIAEVHESSDAAAEVFGEVVEATSADAAVRRIPVSLGLERRGGEWRISRWSPAAAFHPDAAVDSAGAAAVIESYYEAIDGGDYRRAHPMWENEGEASGQSLEEFTSGFSETAGVEVDTGDPGRIEGAAGSRYVEIPVAITATTRAGETQRFRGTYVLRRSVIEGATPEQRGWRIASASMTPVP